ncbi:hypothetical protein DL767_004488 [Monosporascus sp. MG133]|nr:hypothetical protein DL767_004488 [Monosporascus sp. MG133]
MGFHGRSRRSSGSQHIYTRLKYEQTGYTADVGTPKGTKKGKNGKHKRPRTWSLQQAPNAPAFEECLRGKRTILGLATRLVLEAEEEPRVKQRCQKKGGKATKE